MRLKQSRLAQADLDGIFDYGAENFGIEAALLYVDHIEERYKQLIAYPLSGKANSEIAPGLRSLSYRSHRIFYEIDGETIVIQRILHKTRDAKAWLR